MLKESWSEATIYFWTERKKYRGNPDKFYLEMHLINIVIFILNSKILELSIKSGKDSTSTLSLVITRLRFKKNLQKYSYYNKVIRKIAKRRHRTPLWSYRDEISKNRGKKYTGLQRGMKLSLAANLVLNWVCPLLSFPERFPTNYCSFYVYIL